MGEEHECLQTEVLRELRECQKSNDKRFHEGDLRFQSIVKANSDMLEGQVKISNSLTQIDKRLFIDNGTISMQTKMDRHETLLKGMLAAIAAISLAVTAVVVRIIIAAITGSELVL